MALLNMVARKLQEGILQGRRPATLASVVVKEEDGEGTMNMEVPGDVKEGHFAVIAVNNGKPKRFVVPLEVLGEPAFMALLEQAADEFGFAHKGALITALSLRTFLQHKDKKQKQKQKRTSV